MCKMLTPDQDPGYPGYTSLFTSSVVNPDPGFGAFLTPGSGMEKNPDPGFGVNIQDHFSWILETIFQLKIFKFFDADLDPGSAIFLTWIRDPGWKNSDPGSGINITDPFTFISNIR